MRILLLHNHYGHRAVGGEANVVAAEAALLEAHGHAVLRYEPANGELQNSGVAEKARAFWNVAWSVESYSRIQELIRGFCPDVMHVHNTRYILTPSVFKAAYDLGVPTVFTLHNYRMVCPGGQFLCAGRPCERCLRGNPFRILWHRCTPDRSLLKSFLQLRLFLESKKRGHFSRWVSTYIALTDFAKRKFVAGGLPEGKVIVKPNFVTDPLAGGQPEAPGRGAVCIGRMSAEKGVLPLLRAWHALDYPLTVVGEGPQLAAARSVAPPGVRFTGALSHEETLLAVKKSAVLIFPSVCYEGFPLTLLEAMAIGRPVIASDLGARREIVRDGKTGLLFRPDDPEDFLAKARCLIGNPALAATMGPAARDVYLKHYSAEKNYKMLMTIYDQAIKGPEPCFRAA